MVFERINAYLFNIIINVCKLKLTPNMFRYFHSEKNQPQQSSTSLSNLSNIQDLLDESKNQLNQSAWSDIEPYISPSDYISIQPEFSNTKRYFDAPTATFSITSFQETQSATDWNQNILGSHSFDMNDQKIWEALPIPENFLTVLDKFKLPEDKDGNGEVNFEEYIDCELDKIIQFKNEVLPTLRKKINLFDWIKEFEFLHHIIVQLNIKNKGVDLKNNRCYIDKNGILQDCKVPDTWFRDEYKKLQAERFSLDTGYTESELSREYIVNKEELQNIVSEFYQNVKQYKEFKSIREYVKNLHSTYYTSAKIYYKYCEEYKKYENLKETLKNLSTNILTLKENIESLTFPSKSSTKSLEFYNSTKDLLDNWVQDIDLVSLSELQDNIEEAAKKYYYVKKQKENLYQKVKPSHGDCKSCEKETAKWCLGCGHTVCSDCCQPHVESGLRVCGVCNKENEIVIQLN